MIRRVLSWCVLASLCCSAVAADRTILLVTPKGVYQTTVRDGLPGAWVPASDIDVIVQGFGSAPKPPDTPPVDDPVVSQVATLSKAMKDKAEATACAALINSLDKMGLRGNDFKEALDMAAPIADSQLKAGGRIVQFFKSALAITTDAEKLKAGIVSAWQINLTALQQIHEGAVSKQIPEFAAGTDPQEAISWALIIQLIQMIFELLTKLGVI